MNPICFHYGERNRVKKENHLTQTARRCSTALLQGAVNFYLLKYTTDEGV